jgi:hypothetical protein
VVVEDEDEDDALLPVETANGSDAPAWLAPDEFCREASSCERLAAAPRAMIMTNTPGMAEHAGRTE